MVETERAYQKQQQDRLLDSLREAAGDGAEIEGAFARLPSEAPADGGIAALREAGVPVRDAA